jgi:hypothetical protein
MAPLWAVRKDDAKAAPWVACSAVSMGVLTAASWAAAWVVPWDSSKAGPLDAMARWSVDASAAPLVVSLAVLWAALKAEETEQH